MIQNIPEEMKKLDNFLLWKLAKVNGEPKPKKLPMNPVSGKVCGAQIFNCVPFDEALNRLKQHATPSEKWGIGFYITKESGFTCVDFDDVLDGNCDLLPQYERVQEHIEALGGFIEVSQSKKGLHLFIKGNPPGDRTRKKSANFPVEIYSHSRFMAITGDVWQNYTKIKESQEALETLYNEIFPEEKKQAVQQLPQPVFSAERSNDKILEIIKHAKNSDKFYGIFNGARLIEDRSAEDQALANMIAFYTQDINQIVSIMRMSKISRKKWERNDYLPTTAGKAIKILTGFYDWDASDKKDQEYQERKLDPLKDMIQPVVKIPKIPEDIPIFWNIEVKQNKKTGTSFITVSYSDALLKDFFRLKGYRKLPTSSNTQTDIAIVDGCFIERTDPQKIITMLTQYTEKEEFAEMRHELAGMIIKLNQALNSNYWRILDPVQPTPSIDTIDKGFHFFKNGFVEVTAAKITLKPYSEFKGIVWKHQINQFDYKSTKGGGEFERFIQNTQLEKNNKINSMRLASAKTFIGYALHKYHNPSLAKACIIQDEQVRKHKSEANGGTGKSIIASSIQRLRPGFYLDCKMADFKNDAFLYDGAKPDDLSLVFDDVKNSFPFDYVFNQVEHPAMINAKGRNKVPFDNTPKYIITSNGIIDTSSESSKRRVAFLFCSGYYSRERTPAMEFGHNMFVDWDTQEWSLFYDFMLSCLQNYLLHGLVLYEPDRYKDRCIIELYGYDTYLWLSENIVPTGGETKQRLGTDEMLESYKNDTGFKKTEKRELTNKILFYGKTMEIDVKVDSRHGKRYYVF